MDVQATRTWILQSACVFWRENVARKPLSMCVRVCVRLCVCFRACLGACVRASVRASVRACVHCVRNVLRIGIQCEKENTF